MTKATDKIKLVKAKKPKKVNLKDIERFEINGKMYCNEDQLNYYWNSVFEDAAREALSSVSFHFNQVLNKIKTDRGIDD